MSPHKNLIKLFFLALVLIVVVVPSAGSTHAAEVRQKPLTPSYVASVVEQLLGVLDQHYVYPAIAEKMRAAVEAQMLAGKYRKSQTLRVLISKIQADLREVSGDGHLDVLLANDSVDRTSHVRPKTKLDQHFEANLIAENNTGKKIGYLQINKFSGDPLSQNRIVAAMAKFIDSDSLIIDLRDNGGGDPNLVAFLSSYFVDQNTHLWSIFDRNGDPVFEIRSTATGERYRGDVVILTSNKTYSAAEAFAYTLKHLGRASIIGQASGGGAHLVEMQRVNDEIDVRIPVARAYNPITKSNWEGTGVIPTIDVDAAMAKSVAIEFLISKQHD